MNTEEIIYPLEDIYNKETSLKNIANQVLTILQNKFGSEYTVTASSFGPIEKDWTHQIKVRKGNKIGAEVEFKWEKSKPEVVKLEVTESSKLGSQVMLSTLAIFVITGALMGFNKIAPLAFLPGYKIAAILGGFIFLIPALIIATILKSILLKGEKAQNAQLVNEVTQLVRK